MSYVGDSGEAKVLDPTDFIQFIPFGSGVAKPISALEKNAVQGLKQLWPTIIKTTEQSGGAPIKSAETTILGQIKKFIAPISLGGGAAGGAVLKGASTIPKQVVQTVTKNGISTSTKALVALGLATIPTTLTTGFLTQTPGGQNLVNTAATPLNNVSGFLKDNGQLISIFLLLGGAALIIGAIKK